MSNFSALYQNQPIGLSWPQTDLSLLPAKLSKRLWVSPAEFIDLTARLDPGRMGRPSEQSAGGPALPAPLRRGPKVVYQDASIVVMALVQVAWQMGYEEVVDYFRRPPGGGPAGWLCPRVG